MELTFEFVRKYADTEMEIVFPELDLGCYSDCTLSQFIIETYMDVDYSIMDIYCLEDWVSNMNPMDILDIDTYNYNAGCMYHVIYEGTNSIVLESGWSAEELAYNYDEFSALECALEDLQ